MAQQVYTLENIGTVADIISDLAKDLYGTRSACPRTPEAQVAFMNSYEERFAEEQVRENEELAFLGRCDGRTYKTWSEYYDYQESLINPAPLPEALAMPQHYKIADAVAAWEHGAL